MDFNTPQPTSVYSLLLGEIRTGQTDLAKMDFSNSSNIPTGAIQWSAANSRWERYNGSSFEALIATYNINVQNLGGQSASFYRNASNINAGTLAAARLPAASTSAQGAVQLSASTTSNSQTAAATPSAVNAIRQLADGKADASHTHSAGDLPSASTSAAGIVQLNTSTSSTSTSQAATPSAVRAAYNLANGNHSHSAGDLPSASTSAAGVVQLNTSTSSTSTSQAATPSAVRAAYNLANGKANASHNHNASDLTAGTLPAARFNNTAHGNRSGGSLHATATASAHGFMSAADKAKLDAQPVKIRAVRNSVLTLPATGAQTDSQLTLPVKAGVRYSLNAFFPCRKITQQVGEIFIVHIIFPQSGSDSRHYLMAVCDDGISFSESEFDYMSLITNQNNRPYVAMSVTGQIMPNADGNLTINFTRSAPGEVTIRPGALVELEPF